MSSWDDLVNNPYRLPKTTNTPDKDLTPKPGVTGFLNSGGNGTKTGNNTPGNSSIDMNQWTRRQNPYDPQGPTASGFKPSFLTGYGTGNKTTTGTGSQQLKQTGFASGSLSNPVSGTGTNQANQSSLSGQPNMSSTGTGVRVQGGQPSWVTGYSAPGGLPDERQSSTSQPSTSRTGQPTTPQDGPGDNVSPIEALRNMVYSRGQGIKLNQPVPGGQPSWVTGYGVPDGFPNDRQSSTLQPSTSQTGQPATLQDGPGDNVSPMDALWSFANGRAQGSKPNQPVSGRQPSWVTGYGAPDGFPYDRQSSTLQPSVPSTAELFRDRSKFRDQLKGIPGTKKFNEEWEKVAREHRDEFQREQDIFAEKEFYDRFVENILKHTKLDVSKRGIALQKAIWSTAIQYNPYSTVFSMAFKGKDPTKMTNAQIISILQDHKQKITKNDSGRIKRETKMLLKEANEERNGKQ